MGCGSSKNAVLMKEPSTSGAVAGVPPSQAAGSAPRAPRAPREASDTKPIKIWVSLEDTGRRTGVILSGWDQDDAKTVEDLARVLVASHESRLQQLGFSGVALVLFDDNGAVRPPRQKISASELLSCADMKQPLRVGMPPQWSQVAPAPIHAASPGADQPSQTPGRGTMLCSAATTTTASQGSVERATLSPRSKAYRADIEALKRRSPQSKLTVYTPDQEFPDVIKRDMHSHLKKEVEEEPAQSPPPPSETEVTALQKPKAVASQQQATYMLDTARVKELAMQLVGFTSKYRDKDKQALLKDLKSFLEPESWEELLRQSQMAESAWSGQGCIEWLRAYIDFAKHHGLGSKNGKLNLELRDETDAYYPGQIHQTPATKKAYALIPVEWSLLRSMEGVELCYLLDESDGFGVLSRWASGRFLDPHAAHTWEGPAATRPSFGFCGQLPGISKQVIVSHGASAPVRADDRERCLELCRAEDPFEYPLFENANMDAFLIQIQLGASPLVAEALRPRVVLDAAVFCKEELMEQPDGPCWQTMQGFGEGAIPGFNNAGRAVMLIKSAPIKATSTNDLQQAGITCTKLLSAPS